MAYTDQSFLPAAQALLGFLAQALMDHSDPAMHIEIRSGSEVVFDLSQNEDLCCEGLAWVRMGNATPGFPGTDATVRHCVIPVWSLQLEMGIVRCAPVGSDTEIVTASEHATVAALLAEDFMAMRRALCLWHAAHGYDYTLGPWTPVGPAGGCVGSTITVTAQIIGNDQFP